MIVVMQIHASEHEVQGVCDQIRAAGLEPLVLPGDRTAIGIPSSIPANIREDLERMLAAMPGVSKVSVTSRPYKLASMEWAQKHTTFEIKGTKIGAGTFTIMAGPCSVESEEQFHLCGKIVAEAGVKILRGGAFKPRTSPYAFQGLAAEGLRIMRDVANANNLITITEVMSPEMVGPIAEHVDILQIGARSMQNFPLLIEAGKSGKPVFLKRGPSASIDEFLLAAEYVLSNNNPNVMLCERGIVGFDRTYTRNTLDLNAVPVLKEYSHLPVIVDPSHGTGVTRYVPAMAKAAMVAGADGVMVEMHPDPKHAMSDGAQSLDPDAFRKLIGELKALAPFTGVTF
jgi:3-deoxy-7-phosphoheptulonate synthase